MSPEVRDAIENARSVSSSGDGLGRRPRLRGFGDVRALVYAVVLELPGEMTLAELCDELCIASDQSP